MSELISKIVGKTNVNEPTTQGKSSFEIETQTDVEQVKPDEYPKSFQSQKQRQHEQAYLKEQKFPPTTSEFLSQKQKSQLSNY